MGRSRISTDAHANSTRIFISFIVIILITGLQTGDWQQQNNKKIEIFDILRGGRKR
jgi:hypothetical protein